MKKIPDKIIIGFFVFIFGILWYASTKYYIKPDQYNIGIYDKSEKECKIDGIRTSFKTQQVAQSYIKEYQKSFPQFKFTMKTNTLEIKRRMNFNLLNHK